MSKVIEQWLKSLEDGQPLDEASVGKLRGDLSTYVQKNASLQKEFDDLNHMLTHQPPSAWAKREKRYHDDKKLWDEQQEKINSKMKRLNDEIRTLKDSNRAVKLQEELAEAEKKLKASAVEGETLSSKLTKIQTEHKLLTDELAKSKKSQGEAVQEAVSMRMGMRKMEEQLSSKMAELAAESTRAQEARRTLENLRREHREHKLRGDGLKEQMEGMRASQAAAIKKAQQQVDAAASAMEAARERADSEAKKTAEALAQVSGVTKSMASLQSKYDAVVETDSGASAKAKESDSAMEALMAAHTAELDGLRRQILVLDDRCSSATAERSAMTKEVEALKKERTELKAAAATAAAKAVEEAAARTEAEAVKAVGVEKMVAKGNSSESPPASPALSEQRSLPSATSGGSPTAAAVKAPTPAKSSPLATTGATLGALSAAADAPPPPDIPLKSKDSPQQLVAPTAIVNREPISKMRSRRFSAKQPSSPAASSPTSGASPTAAASSPMAAAPRSAASSVADSPTSSVSGLSAAADAAPPPDIPLKATASPLPKVGGLSAAADAPPPPDIPLKSRDSPEPLVAPTNIGSRAAFRREDSTPVAPPATPTAAAALSRGATAPSDASDALNGAAVLAASTNNDSSAAADPSPAPAAIPSPASASDPSPAVAPQVADTAAAAAPKGAPQVELTPFAPKPDDEISVNQQISSWNRVSGSVLLPAEQSMLLASKDHAGILSDMLNALDQEASAAAQARMRITAGKIASCLPLPPSPASSIAAPGIKKLPESQAAVLRAAAQAGVFGNESGEGWADESDEAITAAFARKMAADSAHLDHSLVTVVNAMNVAECKAHDGQTLSRARVGLLRAAALRSSPPETTKAWKAIPSDEEFLQAVAVAMVSDTTPMSSGEEVAIPQEQQLLLQAAAGAVMSAEMPVHMQEDPVLVGTGGSFGSFSGSPNSYPGVSMIPDLSQPDLSGLPNNRSGREIREYAAQCEVLVQTSQAQTSSPHSPEESSEFMAYSSSMAPAAALQAALPLLPLAAQAQVERLQASLLEKDNEIAALEQSLRVLGESKNADDEEQQPQNLMDFLRGNRQQDRVHSLEKQLLQSQAQLSKYRARLSDINADIEDSGSLPGLDGDDPLMTSRRDNNRLGELGENAYLTSLVVKLKVDVAETHGELVSCKRALTRALEREANLTERVAMLEVPNFMSAAQRLAAPVFAARINAQQAAQQAAQTETVPPEEHDEDDDESFMTEDESEEGDPEGESSDDGESEVDSEEETEDEEEVAAAQQPGPQ